MDSQLDSVLSGFDTISLQEMDKVKLMNRTDTKFVTNTKKLYTLLLLLQNDYRVQLTAGKRICGYHTLYFDTPDFAMYNRHHIGRKLRQKVRMREYVSTGDFFLEVKRKNNKGRTKKKRMKISSFEGFDKEAADSFLQKESWYSLGGIAPHVENRFNRITLVNKAGTERLTIDTSLSFHNCITGCDSSFDGITIIELKQDGTKPSLAKPILKELRIFPTGFSKYCMGCVATNPSLRKNRFKSKLVVIKKMISNGI